MTDPISAVLLLTFAGLTAPTYRKPFDLSEAANFESGEGQSTPVLADTYSAPLFDGNFQPPSVFEVAKGATAHERLDATVRSYAHLPGGWDGYSGVAALQDHVNDALEFLSRYPTGYPLPSPMISANGTVGFFWDNERLFADVEFEGDRRFSLYAREKGQDQDNFLEAVSIGELNADWLARVLPALVVPLRLAA